MEHLPAVLVDKIIVHHLMPVDEWGLFFAQILLLRLLTIPSRANGASSMKSSVAGKSSVCIICFKTLRVFFKILKNIFNKVGVRTERGLSLY